jgi:tetratricopeptide (TPR) repeat protein
MSIATQPELEPDLEHHPDRPARRPARRLVAVGVLLALVLLAASALGLDRSDATGDLDRTATVRAPAPAAAATQVNSRMHPSPDTLDELIESLQLRLDRVPTDTTAWATLGLAYVQQAKVTVNPAFYSLADGALTESLDRSRAQGTADDNFLVHAGLSALASARHDFVAARDHARRGLEINDFSAILHGALSDAELQLGNYPAAFAAIDRMIELSPDTASFARASYAAELRGDAPLAEAWMTDALEAAPTPTDRAFALFHLGELAFDDGRPGDALDLYNEARRAAPSDPAALAGKAKAEAALGQVETALDHYAQLVEQAPDPAYLAAYGILLESLGRSEEAAAQFAIVDATRALFADNGVQLDAGPILFEADHGDVDIALAAAETGVAAHPFLAMHDAHAWALHRSGRHVEALAAAERAAATGYRHASFLFHSGMIKEALGDTDGAIADLTAALELNPYFDPLSAPVAAATLADLTDSTDR